MIFSRQWLQDEFLDLHDVEDHALSSILSARQIPTRIVAPSLWEAEIPPRRRDLHCLQGIAREAASALRKPLKNCSTPVEDSGCGSIFEHLDVDVYTDRCRRYSVRMALDCHVAASPGSIRQRLETYGIAPVNNLTDIAACVRLETGQPVDILDMRLLRGSGSVCLRDAMVGEAPQDGAVIFSDENFQPLFTANSLHFPVPQDAGDVLIVCGDFDSGVFSPEGTLSQAAVCPDPLGTLPAVDRICGMIRELGIGQIPDGCLDCLNYVPQPRYLSCTVSENARASLEALGFAFTENGIRIPSFRQDIRSEEDLMQEISRCTNG